MVDFFFPRTRRRYIPTYELSGTARPSIFSGWTPYFTAGGITEECVDQTHSWNPRSKDVRGDVGGPFQLTRSETTHGTTYRLNNTFCVGPVGAKGYNGWIADYASGSMATATTLNAFGTTAIARTTPTSPIAGLATALGELRSDGLPSIPGKEAREATTLARAAGSEYLNVEFGWLPLVSDIRKFCYAVKHSKELIDGYVERSGRKIRVGYGNPGSTSAKTSSGGGFLSPSALSISCTVDITETYQTARKFRGAFRYYVPVGESQFEKLARYESYSNYLLGTRITPEVLWNIAPWSWAIDWFTNTGDVIHNISSLGFDGLVLQYGYATDVQWYTADLSARCTDASKGVPVGTLLTRHDERKWIRRVAAIPYGFGITDASLSAKQQAVLVALGLSWGRRQNPSG